MSEKEFLKALIERGQRAQSGYFEFAHVVACLLDAKLHEQLQQLIDGPVYDGNVISKRDRDELIDLGLAMRVCCKGEQGHTGATYFAFSVMRIARDIRSGKIAA